MAWADYTIILCIPQQLQGFTSQHVGSQLKKKKDTYKVTKNRKIDNLMVLAGHKNI